MRFNSGRAFAGSLKNLSSFCKLLFCAKSSFLQAAKSTIVRIVRIPKIFRRGVIKFHKRRLRVKNNFTNIEQYSITNNGEKPDFLWGKTPLYVYSILKEIRSLQDYMHCLYLTSIKKRAVVIKMICVAGCIK